MGKTIYIGSYVHSLQLTQLEHVERAILCVGEKGIIEWIENIASEELQDLLAKYGLEPDNVEVVELSPDEFLCPGLIDTHTVSRTWVNARECRRRVMNNDANSSTPLNSQISVWAMVSRC